MVLHSLKNREQHNDHLHRFLKAILPLCTTPFHVNFHLHNCAATEPSPVVLYRAPRAGHARHAAICERLI